MEYWVVEDEEKGYRWKKQPFQPFPLPQGKNLAHTLLQHWQEHDEEHWIVFSDEEANEIERLGAPFAAFPADGILRRLVTVPLQDNRRGYVSETYVPSDKPDHILGKSPMQLCIHFNRRV